MTSEDTKTLCVMQYKPNVPLRPIVSIIGYLSLGQTLGWPTDQQQWQLSTPHEQLNGICPQPGFSSSRSSRHNGQFQHSVILHQGAYKGSMDLLGQHFKEVILRLFRHVLATSYFSFNGQFYEQTNGGLATVSGHRELIYGGLRGEGT
jgi:hypothetical protein